MTADIRQFTGNTLCDIDASNILEAALDKDLETAIVMGWTQEGELYLASTTSKTGEIFLLLELAKAYLVEKMVHGN